MSYTAFDELGRVKSSQQITAGQTYTMPDYSYDLSGALVAQTYHSGRVVSIETDSIGRLSEVTSQVPNHAERTYLNNISYNSFGAVERARLGNGVWESAQFDQKRLQIKQIGLGASAGDTSFLKLEYDYGTTDNNGSLRQQKITIPGMSAPLIQTYTYDNFNRLHSATETKNSQVQWKQTFAYDRFGNRRFDAANTTTLPANNGIYNPNIDQAKNQFTVAEGYNYDAEGNLISNPENQLFAYDAENRQTQVQNTATQTTSNYYYDGNGKRVRKIVGDQETIFVYDAFGKLIAEYTTNQAITNDGTKYLTTDALGSPRAISDISGTVVSRHDYMPFGEEVYAGVGGRTAAQGYLTTGDGIRQQFTGYERDGESGLDYAQARYFSSKHGRFTSVDPLTSSANIKNPQTFNRYSYALNSPYKFTDPLGLEPCEIPGGGNTGCIKEKKKDSCPECTWDKEAGKWVPANENIQVEATRDVRPAEDPLLTPGIGLLDTGPRTAPPPIIPPRGAPPPGIAPSVGTGILRSVARGAATIFILPLAVILATASTVQAPLPVAPTTDTTTEEDKDRELWQHVYRVFGGTSPQAGFSWTPIDPRTVRNPADGLGLPPGNTGDSLVEGDVRMSDIKLIRPARPIPPNRGGILEYIINPVDVRNQRVSPLFRPR